MTILGLRKLESEWKGKFEGTYDFCFVVFQIFMAGIKESRKKGKVFFGTFKGNETLRNDCLELTLM